MEYAGEGTDDLPYCLVVTYILPLNVETLSLMAGSSAVEGYGNSQNNVINGNENDNILGGGNGADRLRGYAGNDNNLLGDNGDDPLEGGFGNDYLHGGARSTSSGAGSATTIRVVDSEQNHRQYRRGATIMTHSSPAGSALTAR